MAKIFSVSTKHLQDKLRDKLKELMKEQGLDAQGLADKIKENYIGYSDSRTNVLNKLRTATIKYTEAVQIFDVLGYELKLGPKPERTPKTQ
jgi:hypothetical protein